MLTRVLLSLALLSLVVVVQVQLWVGRGSIPNVQHMKEELTQVQARNQQALLRNEQLRNEVRDLQEGLLIIEEKARYELGMVKDNEVFVQFSSKSSR